MSNQEASMEMQAIQSKHPMSSGCIVGNPEAIRSNSHYFWIARLH
jgi:hypothetical protein